MKTVTATELKNKMGQALIKAQSEPVQINKNGEPVAVMLSMHEYTAMKELILKTELQRGLDAIANNQVIDGTEAFAEIRAARVN